MTTLVFSRGFLTLIVLGNVRADLEEFIVPLGMGDGFGSRLWVCYTVLVDRDLDSVFGCLRCTDIAWGRHLVLYEYVVSHLLLKMSSCLTFDIGPAVLLVGKCRVELLSCWGPFGVFNVDDTSRSF